jgi:hypothetical protein
MIPKNCSLSERSSGPIKTWSEIGIQPEAGFLLGNSDSHAQIAIGKPNPSRGGGFGNGRANPA